MADFAERFFADCDSGAEDEGSDVDIEEYFEEFFLDFQDDDGDRMVRTESLFHL